MSRSVLIFSIILIGVLLIWPVLFFSSALMGTNNLQALEEVTGGNFCSNGDVHKVEETLSTSSAKQLQKRPHTVEAGSDRAAYKFDNTLSREDVVEGFDKPEATCLELNLRPFSIYLDAQKWAELEKNSGYVVLNNAKIPLIATRQQNFDRRQLNENETIVVRLPGGPGNAEIFSTIDTLIDYDENTLVIDFFYTGNGFNLLYPNENFSVATNQLQTFLRTLRKRNPKAKILLVGESLGAVISASAIVAMSNEHGPEEWEPDHLILLSPPFGSHEETGRKLEEMFGQVPRDQRLSLYRIRSSGADYNKFGNVKKVDWLEVFRSFSTNKESKVRLHDRIRQIPSNIPVTIIYGSADERIRPELADVFLTSPVDNVELFMIEGMEHQFSSFGHISDIRAALSIALEE